MGVKNREGKKRVGGGKGVCARCGEKRKQASEHTSGTHSVDRDLDVMSHETSKLTPVVNIYYSCNVAHNLHITC